MQRMRNLVTGDYGSQTKKQTGYKKYKNKKAEGDVWEEKGRTWTIKNGVKQNLRKLGKAKEYSKIPLKCPSCSDAMNTQQDKFMYTHHGHCLHCQTQAEFQMRREGTYDNWVIDNVKKNFASWKLEKQEQFKQHLKDINSKHFITEVGLVEDWSEVDSQTKEYMVEKFNEFSSKEEAGMEKLIKEREEKQK